MCTKTLEEVAELKRQWLEDPCFDLEDTPGFEDHREDLLAFKKIHEWRAIVQWGNRVKAVAKEIGTADNLVLAKYIIELRDAVENLRDGFQEDLRNLREEMYDEFRHLNEG